MNRLHNATSPYLQQHADNPVDWWEWGPEAFAAARERDVPVLLSVGYAACHWCHVMAHESFEDDATARVVNENFVAIKVDREERPDVDAVYMEAVQAATGQGGWPMTVFLTPDRDPFYFGTYFPPEPRHGMPSFRQVLGGVADAWRGRREEVTEVAGRIVAELTQRGGVYAGLAGAETPGPDALRHAVAALAREYDGSRGGFGGAPKFPPSMVLEFLLRHHATTGSDPALEMAVHACEAMARGGIYDQLGGGFARYSVDAAWVVPHFEKMLYDNALLLRVYTHLWRATGSALARRVAVETGEFLLRELRTAEGGFASALDADSADPADAEGHSREGAFYVWTPEQLVDALGAEDGARAAELFGVTAEGTFEEGASVLQLPGEEPEPELRARLFEARELRPRPARDDKVVAAWNGLAVAALAEAGALLDRPEFLDAAVVAAALLLDVHRDASGRLLRTSRDGRPGTNVGVLEDYGDVAEGLVTLHNVTGDRRWLDAAGELLEVVLTQFTDASSGALFDTAADAEQLIRRPQDPTDNAAPSGWSAAAGAMLSYATLTESERHREAAERALTVVTPLASRAPRFIGWGLAVAEALLDGPRRVALVGEADNPATLALRAAALGATAPGLVITPDEEKPLADGKPAAYVCRRFTCDAPVTDPQWLREGLNARPGE